LDGGGQIEADDGRIIGLRKFLEADEEFGGASPQFSGELDRPATNVGIVVLQRLQQKIGGNAAGDMEGPEGAESASGVFVGRGEANELAAGDIRCAAFLKDAAGLADVPVITVELEIDEFLIGEFLEIDVGRLGVAINDFEDAAVGAIVALVFTVVAFIFIVPVDDVDLTIGSVAQVEHLGPFVVGEEEVGCGVADVTGAARGEEIHIEARAVDVVHDELVAVFGGPVIGEIDHGPGVGVAPPCSAGGGSIGIVPLVADPVTMFGDGGDIGVGVGVEVLAPLTMVARSLNDVEEVGDDAACEEGLSVVVEIDAPGIAGAVSKDFELMSLGVIAPDACVEGDALIVGGTGFPDAGVSEDAVATVEPAIGSPDEGVQCFVGVFESPAIEEDFGSGVGYVVAVAIGNEEEFGGLSDPDAAETDFESTDEIEFILEDFADVGFAVAVGVFEDEDAVLAFGGFAFEGIGIGLGDPEAAPIINGHGDGLLDVGFTGDEESFEACGENHFPGGFLGGESGVLGAAGDGCGTGRGWRFDAINGAGSRAEEEGTGQNCRNDPM